ncbi:MAG TPA: sugar transferase [Elusimicrobiota bacterium]|nr:sugar transferase [Elusimicrobiota bacterium]
MSGSAGARARSLPARPAAARAALPRWLRHALRTALHFVCDGAAIVGAYWLAYLLRFRCPWVLEHMPLRGGDPGWELYAQMLWTAVPVWLGLFRYSSRLYSRPWMSGADRFLQIVKGAVFGTLAILAATYIYSRLAYSRLMLLAAGPLAVATVSAAHFLVLKLDAALSLYESAAPLVLIGGGKVAELIRENVKARHPLAGVHVLAGTPSPDALIKAVRETGAEEVVLVAREADHARLLELAEACESEGLAFKMIPDLLELRLGEVQMDESLGLPAYRIQHTSLTRANFAAKRAFDVLFSLLVFLVAGIPLLIVGLLIRLDSKGPALFKQKRVGLKGRTFEAYKFRTMVTDAEAALADVRGRNSQKGGFFKAKDDPRVTRVGRWLRRFSVDEFPQFINVLSGDMSVVGPRPLAVATEEMDELIAAFGPTAKKRMNMLPGITGLWQVSGRSDISAEQRFALDMFYLEHWSLGLDLEIILKTVPAMVSAKGAY